MAPGVGLKARAAAGVRWLGIASAVRALLMVLRLAVLARLLSPSDFGLMSLVSVVLGFAQAYIDAGLSTSVIQRQEQDPDRLATLFWINVLLGVLTFAIVVLLRAPIALALNQPTLAPLLAVAALQLPIAAFGLQHAALLRREFEFKATAVQQIAVDSVNVLLAVVLASLGYGVWSLIYAALAGAALGSASMIAMGIRRWPLRLRFRPKEVTQHLRFGAYELGRLSVTYLSSNADSLLIGSLIGTDALGLYTMATRLTQLPRKYVAPVISRVALPVFARQQDNIQRMRGSLLTIQRMLGYVNAPLTLGLMLTAPVVVPLLSGSQWAGAVPLVSWLSVPVLLTGVAGPSQIVRIALGQFRFDFHWSWITGGMLALAMWAAAGHGLEWVVVVRSLLLSLISLVLIGITMRLVATSPIQFLTNLKRPALAALVMGAAVYLAMVSSEALASWQRAGLSVGLGAVVYASVAFACDRRFILDNLRAIFGVRAK